MDDSNATHMDADTALARLKDGNRRFVARIHDSGETTSLAAQWQQSMSHQPFAIVLGCSDARVPAELVFDQGFGELFVIRVAGNVVSPSQIGSVEFAASSFGIRLVVVLGHTHCGAIQATLDQLQKPPSAQSRNLQAIVDRVRPSVEGLLHTELRHDHEALVRHAVRANIGVSVSHLRYSSDVLEQLIREEGLRVVGAEYSLETGAVEFFDAP